MEEQLATYVFLFPCPHTTNKRNKQIYVTYVKDI